MKRLAQRIFLACALIGLPAAAQAQPFPAGPIGLVVPLAPGDAADIAARALGDEISRLLKTPVLSINRPGAGGAVGTNAVVQAKKDGHTILFAQNSALTFRAVLDPQSVTYDALRNLVPLGIASRTPTILVVRSDAPYRNFAELIAIAATRAFLASSGIPAGARKLNQMPNSSSEQAVKAPGVTARLASLGIVQSYASPEQAAAEIRAEFKRVGELARKTGLVK